MHLLNQPLPPPPRILGHFTAARLFLHRVRSSVVFLVGTIFLIVGSLLTIGITGGFWSRLREERALLADGAYAQATLVAKRAYNRSDDTRVYQLSYQFPLGDGRTWAATRDIDQGEWNRLQAGDRLEVRYDRANPDRHLMPVFATPVALALLGLTPLVFLVLGALLFRAGLREVLLPLRLYRTGHVARGRVTGLQVVTNERINRRHPVRVSYAFRNGAAGERQGSIKTLDTGLLDLLLKGTEVTVLYDRREPEMNTLLAALGGLVQVSRQPSKGSERNLP
jgi:hypothetical protein